MSRGTPELEHVIREAADARVALVHTGMPGKVISYDHTTQKATVQPIPKGAYDDEDGVLQRYQFQPIANVPVMFPSSSGGYAITFPLTVGDHGWISFGERSIDEWLANGEDTTEPADLRRHDLTDAVFFPGTRSFAKAIGATGYDTGAMVLEAGTILLGSSAAVDFVALADKVLTELQAIQAWADAHVHTGVTAGAALTGAPTVVSPVPGSVAATKVKAE